MGDTADETGGTVGQVIGENLKRIREERKLTQHEAARLCAAAGLSWTRTRIAVIERGDRETVDVGTLLLLAAAFDVSVSALFSGAGHVKLSPLNRQTRAGVQQMLSTTATWRDLSNADKPETMRFTVDAVEADVALADRLDVSTRRVVEAAVRLWGQSLTEERDRRVAALGDLDPGERQAHRGHITRELGQQVEQVIGLYGEHDRFVAEWQERRGQIFDPTTPSLRALDQFRVESDPVAVDEWFVRAKRQAMQDYEHALIGVRGQMHDLGLPLPALPDEFPDLDLLRLAELSEPLGESEADVDAARRSEPLSELGRLSEPLGAADAPDTNDIDPSTEDAK